jgi:hypothetical protein
MINYVDGFPIEMKFLPVTKTKGARMSASWVNRFGSGKVRRELSFYEYDSTAQFAEAFAQLFCDWFNKNRDPKLFPNYTESRVEEVWLMATLNGHLIKVKLTRDPKF